MKGLFSAMLMAATTILGSSQAAQAGPAADAALGLGAFAVFNQLVRGETIFHTIFQPAPPVVVQQPVVVAESPPVLVPPPHRMVAAPVIVIPRPPVVYVMPPAPLVYYAAPPIAHAPGPVYYAPKRVRSAHPGKFHAYRGRKDFRD